jgi:hypothetical protein
VSSTKQQQATALPKRSCCILAEAITAFICIASIVVLAVLFVSLEFQRSRMAHTGEIGERDVARFREMVNWLHRVVANMCEAV